MQVGRHSRKLLELRKAIRQGALTTDGLLPIEGPILLEEAHRSGLEIAVMFVRSGVSLPAVPAKEVHEVPRDVFKTIQETEHSQGIVGLVRPRHFTMGDVLRTTPALIVMLGRLQDPGNVGTILRVSEAFGATGCIAFTGTASFHNSKVVRASAGSVFRLPHVSGVDVEKIIDELKKKDIRIIGTAPASDATIAKWDWTVPTAVLIGNEGSGLKTEELRYCDGVLRIPHKPTVESLNSAIAAAIVLYEASKQRH
jgi:RNA methyltransferase, TrmH family